MTPVLQLPSRCTMALPTAVRCQSSIVTVAPASATSTVPVMVCAAWLVAPPAAADRHHRRGGIEREAQRGGAGIAEAIGLARHDGVGAVGKPARGERPGPGGVSRHGGGDGAAVDAEVHHGAGKPAAAQRIIRGDAVAGRGAGIDAQRLGHVSAPVVLSV